MAQPNKQSKAMSSRLLTMKFMQRAAASPSSPSTPPGPPKKKQRLSNGSAASTPSTSQLSDAQVVEEALAAGEQRRTQALEKEAADRGETKWYLSFTEPRAFMAQQPMRVVSAGYSMLDHDVPRERIEQEEEGSEPESANVPGRRSFGNFNRTIQKQQKPALRPSDSSSDSSDDELHVKDDSDDPTVARALIAHSRTEAGNQLRRGRESRKKAENTEALRSVDGRRKKQINLNELASISANTGFSGGNTKDITCHRCGEKGHKRTDCPKSRTWKR